MPQVHIHNLDLNLLRVFDALADEGSVTRAGARLGLTQSAVSHALNRLRFALKDELFVRGAEGMRPTPRAQEIAPRLRQGLAQLQAALAPSTFVPAQTERSFTFAASAYVATILLPGVVERLRREAPRAELRIQAAPIGLADDLEAGRADIAIGIFGQAPERFAREALFEDSLVWALRADHPAANGPLTLERLVDLPHVILGTADEARAVDGRVLDGGLERRVVWDDRGAFESALAAAGRGRAIGLRVHDSQSALAIVARSDMAALVPRRLAQAFAGQHHLKLFDPPYVSTPTAIEALWRPDLAPPPVIDWLLRLLREAAAEL